MPGGVDNSVLAPQPEIVPYLAAYETQLARSRYYSKQKFAHPEATIRPKRAARSSRTARAQRRRR